jgi:hypothetical protein
VPTYRLPVAASRGARHPRVSRSTLAGCLVAMMLLAAACGPRNAGQPPAVVEPAVGDLVATLHDHVQPQPGRRVAWATTWKLCWTAYPNASAYELQAKTSEGSGTSVQRQGERCFSIEAARGEHSTTEWRKRRGVLLTLAAGQLAYRVRAVLDDHRVSTWSAALPVGLET